MRYLLILRFPGDAFDDFDEIVALEGALAERLGELGVLDNHDVSSDECRMAFLTPDPVRAFGDAKGLLERKGLLEAMVALYHASGSRESTVLWPTGPEADATRA